MSIEHGKNPSCQAGTPNGILAIITTGEVKGIILNQKAVAPSGFLMALIMTRIARMMGIMMGIMNCCASSCASTAEPTAANKELYNKISADKEEDKTTNDQREINRSEHRKDILHFIQLSRVYLPVQRFETGPLSPELFRHVEHLALTLSHLR